MQAGKSYFFRVINVGSVHYQVLKFQHHDMTIVEIDGAFVRPSKVCMPCALPCFCFPVCQLARYPARLLLPGHQVPQ